MYSDKTCTGMNLADDVLRRDRLHVRHRAAQRIDRDGAGCDLADGWHEFDDGH